MPHGRDDLDASEWTASELDESGPERTCVVTRQKASPEHLIRFVCGPDGVIVPDIRAKLPGRGAWVTAQAEIVRLGVKRGVVARALRVRSRPAKGSDVSPALIMLPDMAEFVDQLLESDALQGLALANKAGMVISGYAKLEASLAQQTMLALFHASDGGPDGRRKLGQVQRRFALAGLNPGALGDIVTIDIDIFHSSQLSLALGRENVIHAGLMSQPGAASFLARISKLMEYRASASPDAARKAVMPGSGDQMPGNGVD